MPAVHLDDGERTERGGRRALLGALVLLLTCLFSNLASLHLVPGDAFDQRAAIHLVRELGAAGFFGQLATGVWLALALLFDLRRAARWAMGAWLVALGLFTVPVPKPGADLALAPAILFGAALLALLARALETATRRDPL
jgi:hypothetical protein